MAIYSAVCSLALVLLGFAAAPAHADTRLTHYRGVTLGDSVARAVEEFGAAGSLKVLFTAPAVVHELTWRPNRFVSGSVVAPDPLGDLVMTFLNDRLVRMVATYDRNRTEGLTDADVIELLTDNYGLPMLMSRDVAEVAESRQTISMWGDTAVLVRLWTETHPRRVGLTIVSNDDVHALEAASAAALVLDREGAPARDLASRAAAAALRQQLEDKARIANKANFKP